MDQTPFLIGFAVMSLASLAIYAKGRKAPPFGSHTLLHASVPFIAATAYLAMFMGIGTIVKPDGAITYVARYLDWSVTTPILLAGLAMVALHARTRTGEAAGLGGYLTALIVLDVLMIVAGLVSSLAIFPAVKWIWYAWSCAAFLGVLFLLWLPLRARANEGGAALAVAYTRNLLFLTVVWFLYPLVFLVSPEGIGAITDTASVWAILVLDVVAKVVYAFFAAASFDAAVDAEGARADLR